MTMGGSVNAKTIALLREDGELRELVACVETRKCVMPVADFLKENALEEAFAIEQALLEMQLSHHGSVAVAASDRIKQLRERL